MRKSWDLQSISVWAFTAWRRALAYAEADLSTSSLHKSVSLGRISARTCDLNHQLFFSPSLTPHNKFNTIWKHTGRKEDNATRSCDKSSIFGWRKSLFITLSLAIFIGSPNKNIQMSNQLQFVSSTNFNRLNASSHGYKNI